MNFRSPVSSVDGKKLFVIGEQRRGELVRFESKSGQFVPFLGGISARDLDVSRDGQWVAYVSYPDGVLWRSRVDGSQRLQLSSLPMQAWLPRWSPDGKQIVFAVDVSGGPDRIYVVAADGGRPAQLTAGNHYETDPNWSPDQNSLMIGGEPWFEDSVAIHILDLKTRQVSTLPGSEGLFSPHWSPDGRYVVAMSRDSQKLMLFEFDTQKWSELVSSPAAFPNWSRDGRYIYFSNPYIAEPGLYRVRISDRKLESVASLSRKSLDGPSPGSGPVSPGMIPHWFCETPAAKKSTVWTGKRRKTSGDRYIGLPEFSARLSALEAFSWKKQSVPPG